MSKREERLKEYYAKLRAQEEVDAQVNLEDIMTLALIGSIPSLLLLIIYIVEAII